ncbi:HD-domain/PDEase-like protein [Sporormia fimetaria CBS 119925]|uniref:Phosphodiesterase n=1 Tax=Sporormia fimetaria CBS 119925 TaxID=1340428 RepID=A0A6A6VPK3_9PLEO|nr:HD-domain/PDEase-like protein [Sporormia fimetaria CBS 119925]
MEHGACNVIYTNRRAHDEHVRRESLSTSLVAQTSTSTVPQGYFGHSKAPTAEIHSNVELILSAFNEVHICASGQSCLDKITELLGSPHKNAPTIVLIDIPYDEEQRLKRLSREPRTPSPAATRSRRSDTAEPDDIYGIHLLTHVHSEIQSQNMPKLVIPVAVLSGLDREMTLSTLPSPGPQATHGLPDAVRLIRYLDAGAVDVLPSPLSKDHVQGLAVHAYRIHKEVSREEAAFLTTKRNRKLSWVGHNDAKPYAYLREAMVSNLMSRICNPETVGDSLDPSDLYVGEDRRKIVADAIGSWSFSAHDFTDDELLHGALLMLKHALAMPELEQWAMTDDELIIFLLASRTAYNEFVLYHNFRHVSDVLQALFVFLVNIGTLPPYPPGSPEVAPELRSPIAQLLSPFDALTLLISAIGHDVGHPGVNNAFLVALNAPLAQLYNDRSVLESFHCAAFSQILRRYWPKAFADSPMRKLMINSILATDMGLHFKYMHDMGKLQEKLAHDQGIIDSWNAKTREEHKDLACGLLIKCADISNVARKFDVARKWADILTDEFSNQGVMEQELEIPSCLFGGPPVRDDLIKLGESQTGFINLFARPLFEGVADILPGMNFAVEEILTNRSTWEKKMEEARSKVKKNPNLQLGLGLIPPSFSVDPTPSPFSGPPLKMVVDAPGHAVPDTTKAVDPARADRRASTGSVTAIFTDSRRGSLTMGLDKSSSIPGIKTPPSHEDHNQSRRGSADASLTAILVTHTHNSPDKVLTNPSTGSAPRASSPHRRKDTLTKYPSNQTHHARHGSADRAGTRPLTAPSQAGRSKVANVLFSTPRASSHSHSHVNLYHAANGAPEPPLPGHWDASKSGDGTNSMTDPSRDPSRRNEWWRLSSRRRTRDVRNGDTDAHGQPKDMALDLPPVNGASQSTSPTAVSPGKNSKAEKLKTFFKWKPRTSEEHNKQLSSVSSSSHLRTPPTSDPGVSINSDD